MTAKADTNPLREALADIKSWRDDTLGKRPKDRGEYDCAPEITEAFDRGARMAFYRCADRATAALASEPVAGTVRAIPADYFDRHPAEAPPAYAALANKPVTRSVTIAKILNDHFWTGEPGQHDAIKAATIALDALSTPAPAGREAIARAIATQLGENYERLVDLHLNAGFCQDDFLRAADAILAFGATVSPQTRGAGEPLQCLRCGTVDAFGPVSVEKK